MLILPFSSSHCALAHVAAARPRSRKTSIPADWGVSHVGVRIDGPHGVFNSLSCFQCHFRQSESNEGPDGLSTAAIFAVTHTAVPFHYHFRQLLHTSEFLSRCVAISSHCRFVQRWRLSTVTSGCLSCAVSAPVKASSLISHWTQCVAAAPADH
mmetsp:Transcript_37527/g.74499  ORF Transcript_37527/g.74499 Transcript_37527/m.74499 type:complete len:154 (+) Transcript_37527:1751-2212(+)